MKLFTASQIKACDAYTIHASSISSFDLMERAAARCVEWLTAHQPKDTVFVVLCGSGNNGGDGLAITRMLHRMGYGVKAFLLQFADKLSEDCEMNLKKLQHIDASLVEILQPDAFITDIPANIIIIDAILGTGLNRAVEGWVADFINHINQLPNRKIAIDIPSGMPADTIPADTEQVLAVNDTLSFQFYKRAFLHPETGKLAGDIHILDIGLNQTFIEATATNYNVIDSLTARSIYKPRQPFSHKGTYGTALLVGGSHGMMGAITLSSKAAMRAGAGKVKVMAPECGYTILQTALPEAMFTTKGDKYISAISGYTEDDTIGIGPGMGTHEYTIKAFADFIETYKNPLVIDADAINILAKQPELLHKIPADSIITPHPKEFEKLFGKTGNSMQRLELARTQAMRYNIYIILKDRYSAVVTPEGECWYNITGNAGMATGGSGDVLTGILTALLAQGYSPYDAALLGVYIHGRAGDLAAEAISQEALIAGDIVNELGSVYKELAAS